MSFGKFLLIKLHYFLFNAGVAPLIIFGPTIAKQSGYAAVTVGLMYTILPLTGLLVKTISGAIADKFNKKKLVFLLAIFCCLFSTLCMAFLSYPTSRKKTTLLCGSDLFLSTCNEKIVHLRREPAFNKSNSVDMNCEIRCYINEVFAREICDHWGHCSDRLKYAISHTPDSPSEPHSPFNQQIAMFVKIEKKHIFRLNNCIYALVKENADYKQDEFTSHYCTKHVTANCTTVCDNYEFMNLLQTEGSPLKSDLSKGAFWIIFIIFAINWAGMALTNSMSDTVCFDILGNEPHLYGKQRMFGALGWGLVSIFAGWIVDGFSDNFFDKNYKPLFYFASILLSADLIAAAFITVNKTAVTISIFRDVRLLFSGWRTTVFAFWCFVTGLFSGIVWNFLFWFLEDISTAEDLQWSKTLQGLDSLFTTIIGELPFFFISGWILKKLGHIRLMSLVLFAISVRLLGYSLLTRPAWVLPIELVNGFAFSMCYVVIASYSNLIAPRGAEATVQALFSALFDGLGISSGGLLAGVIYHRYGGRFLFRLFGYISVIIGFGHLFIQRCLDSKTENKSGQGPRLKDDLSSAQYSSPNDAIRILESS